MRRCGVKVGFIQYCTLLDVHVPDVTAAMRSESVMQTCTDSISWNCSGTPVHGGVHVHHGLHDLQGTYLHSSRAMSTLRCGRTTDPEARRTFACTRDPPPLTDI